MNSEEAQCGKMTYYAPCSGMDDETNNSSLVVEQVLWMEKIHGCS